MKYTATISIAVSIAVILNGSGLYDVILKYINKLFEAFSLYPL